jgi:hypothetical protein
MEAICSSETSVLMRATERNIPKNRILLFYTLFNKITKWKQENDA